MLLTPFFRVYIGAAPSSRMAKNSPFCHHTCDVGARAIPQALMRLALQLSGVGIHQTDAHNASVRLHWWVQ